MSPPRLEELVGAEDDASEREALRRAHEALLAAGPPPELTPRLAAPLLAARRARRRLGAVAALAAALAIAAFAGGWVARGERSFETVRVVEMHATAWAPDGRARIRIGPRDENGNWPMEVDVEGLRPLPDDGYYVLLLTHEGEPVAPCGTFKVGADGTARVRLGASYRLDRFSGWVVQPYVHGRDRFNETVALTT